jgi:hypothetical protein
MTENPNLDRLRALRARVEEACVRLALPAVEALEHCSCLLESVRSELARYCAGARGAPRDPQMLFEAQRLQAAVHRAGQLLRSAWEYHATWSQRWLGLGAGYAPPGMTAPPERRGLICLSG